MDRGATEPAEILDGGIEADRHVRRAETIDVDPAIVEEVERRLDAGRDAIARFFGRPLGAREGVNFLRYRAGDFYLPHVDRTDDQSWPDAARRQVAVVLFLNGAVAGGALHVIDAKKVVIPAEGLLVAFDAGLLHEVEAVTGGVRDVVVDWFY